MTATAAIFALVAGIAGLVVLSGPAGTKVHVVRSPRPGATPATATAPAVASPTPVPIPSPGEPLNTVKWPAAVGPELNCGSDPTGGSVPVDVAQIAYVHPAPGTLLALVLARCSPGAGSPPDELLSYDAALTPTVAHLFQVLLSGSLDRLANSFVAIGSTISMHEVAYSSWSVGSCCPDLRDNVTWTWVNGRYQGSPGEEAGGPPITVTVTASPQPVKVGNEVTFVARVTNMGTSAASAVRLIPGAQVPTCAGMGCNPQVALTWIGGSTSCQPDQSLGQSVCNLGTLPGGQSTQVRLVLKVLSSANPLRFTAVVEAATAAGRVSATGAYALAVQP